MRILLIIILLRFFVGVSYAGTEEDAIKMSFIFRFVEFIDSKWPKTDAQQEIKLCVFGDFDEETKNTYLGFAGKNVLNKKSAIIPNPKNITNCNILYFTKYAKSYKEFLPRDESNILTIGDIPYFNHEGGIIEFYNHRNKIRFRINEAQAIKSQIQFNAKLLEMGSN